MKCDELKRFDIVGKYSDEETMYEFRPDGVCYDADEVDAAFAELKQKIEDAKATAYAESVDAGMRERRLRRELWSARANNARNSYLKWNLFANFESEDKLFTIDEYDETPGVTDFSTIRTYAEWCKVWKKVECKCLKKAEEYK